MTVCTCFHAPEQHARALYASTTDEELRGCRVPGCDCKATKLDFANEECAKLRRQRDNLFLYAALTAGKADAEAIRDAVPNTEASS